jgi:hypothetical protein
MLFLSPIRQHDLIGFTHLLVAGLGMYAFLRCLGSNALGAVFGGIVWEFNGYSSFWLTMDHAAIASAWLPLMMLGATLAIRKQSAGWAISAGSALGICALGGFINHVFLGIVIFTVWYGLLAARAARNLLREERRRDAVRCLCLPIGSAIVALVVSAASWFAMFNLLSNVHREPDTIEYQLRETMLLRELAGALIRPDTAVTGVAGKFPEFESFAYCGIPALLLALAGLFRRSMAVFFSLALSVVSFGAASGTKPLLLTLRALIPYVSAIHLYTWLYIFCFAIAVLSAFGITNASRLLNRTKLPRHLWSAVGCVVLAVEAWQLISFGWLINPTQPARPEWLFPKTPLIEQLQSLQGSYHILPIYFRHPRGLWTSPVLTGKTPSLFGLHSGSGYESLLPLPTAAFWRTVELGGSLASEVPTRYRPYFYHDRLPVGLLEKASVGFLVAPPKIRPVNLGEIDSATGNEITPVYEGTDGWIYKLEKAMPRAFLVPGVVASPDAPTALKIFADPRFDARAAAVVIGEETAAGLGLPSSDSGAGATDGQATIIHERFSRMEIETTASRASLMVVHDSWDPGWRAYVDGVQQPVLRVNYAFRGVVVPEGTHRVELVYRPTRIIVGVIISAVALLALIVLSLRSALSRRRRRRDPDAKRILAAS